MDKNFNLTIIIANEEPFQLPYKKQQTFGPLKNYLIRKDNLKWNRWFVLSWLNKRLGFEL